MRKVSRAKMGGARVCSTLPAVVLLVIFCALSSGVCRSQTAASQTSGKPDAGKPWLNTAWTPEQRAAVLVDRMTLEEKASQLVNQARAIPRLGVPAYDWWSEALHGVLANGTTSFPEPIGLAATFDTAGIHEMAEAIAVEGRIKHAQDGEPRDGQAGHSNVSEGLDFWAPNVNIFRDPRWGRGQETYGEDPFLSARMGVAYVTGMQGDDPQHYRAIATPKHFAVHSGPESTRHNADVQVSKHDELDTYLPAFRAAVTEGQAGSVMCAYNAINGEPACANQFLLQDQLRGHWGFKGYVVSDCGAVLDIHDGHKFTATQAESSAISLRRGMDNECVDASFKVTGKRDYQPYLDAISQGFLRETEIDTALTRLFTARIKLGMFDPPALDPYAHIDAAMLDSTAHRDLARKLANESMVLLKNDGVLPLKTGLKIALVGPLATQTKVLLGNYNGNPSHTVSILEGLRNELGMDNIRYVAGTQFLSTESEAVPASALSTAEGKPGLNASYFPFTEETLSHPGAAKAVAQRREDTVDATTAAAWSRQATSVSRSMAKRLPLPGLATAWSRSWAASILRQANQRVWKLTAPSATLFTTRLASRLLHGSSGHEWTPEPPPRCSMRPLTLRERRMSSSLWSALPASSKARRWRSASRDSQAATELRWTYPSRKRICLKRSRLQASRSWWC
jgi:beta-glucosidase